MKAFFKTCAATFAISLVITLIIALAISPAAGKDTDNKDKWPDAKAEKLIKQAKKRMVEIKGETIEMKEKEITVFLFLGQSNMVGQAPAEHFPKEYQQKDSKILRLEDKGWVVQNLDKKRNGPEVAFAAEYRKKHPDETIGIIKVAVGGSGVRAFLPEWDRKTADLTGDGDKGPLYYVIKSRILQAMEISKPKFKAAFWKQGGKDMKSQEFAKGYAENLTKIIKELRKDTEKDKLPFFIGTYLSKEQLNKKKFRAFARQLRPAAPEVMDAYVKVSNDNKYTYLVNHGILPTYSDGIHFNAESLIKLGKMFFDSYEDKKN